MLQRQEKIVFLFMCVIGNDTEEDNNNTKDTKYLFLTIISKEQKLEAAIFL